MLTPSSTSSGRPGDFPGQPGSAPGRRPPSACTTPPPARRRRAAPSDLSLTSDFIVGFPGETEADFEATLRLAAELGFDGSFSFLYSPRPGTPAANLPRQ